MSVLKDLRNKMFADLEKGTKLKRILYDKCCHVLNGHKSNESLLISINELRTLDIGEVVKVSEGVEFEKIKESANEMTFITTMIEGGRFELHHHDCIEVCKILSGYMIETQRANIKSYRVYNVGDVAVYYKNESHALHATEYTQIEVRFLKEI